MGKQWKEFIILFGGVGSKITAHGDCSPKLKRHLLLGRKVMTNLDSILKSRDITLSTKVCLVKAMVFPVVMYGSESWTIKKAECRSIDGFELWCWRRLLRLPWTARRSNQSILKEISPGCSLEGLKLKHQYFGHLMEELTHWKRPWCWERLRAGGEGDDSNETVGWHHRINGHGFGWTQVVGDRQGNLACCEVHGVTKSQTQLSDWTDWYLDHKKIVFKTKFRKKKKE